MESQALAALAAGAAEDLKAKDVKTLDVRKLTAMTDFMVFASGTSSRHVKSIAQNVIDVARGAGERPIGSEGTETGEWVLVDFGAVVVHLMGEDSRRFYALEKLWSDSEGK